MPQHGATNHVVCHFIERKFDRRKPTTSKALLALVSSRPISVPDRILLPVWWLTPVRHLGTGQVAWSCEANVPSHHWPVAMMHFGLGNMTKLFALHNVWNNYRVGSFTDSE